MDSNCRVKVAQVSKRKVKVEKLKLKVSQSVSPQSWIRSRSGRQMKRKDSFTKEGRDGKKRNVVDTELR